MFFRARLKYTFIIEHKGCGLRLQLKFVIALDWVHLYSEQMNECKYPRQSFGLVVFAIQKLGSNTTKLNFRFHVYLSIHEIF